METSTENRKMVHDHGISTFEAEQAANPSPEGDPDGQCELHPIGDSCAQLWQCSVGSATGTWWLKTTVWEELLMNQWDLGF